jgi:hypothetical protein
MGQAIRRPYGIECDDRAVERPNRGADDQVRDYSSFRQGLEHPDLDGPKATATTEDESHWSREGLCQFDGRCQAAHAVQP